jgi:hypothetical protein
MRLDSRDGPGSSSDEDELTDTDTASSSEFSSSEDELYDVAGSVVELHNEAMPEFSVIDL